MRFLILVRSTDELEAETVPATPDEALFGAMAAYHEELAKAGVLLDAAGLQPSRTGWRMVYDAKGSHLTDGPFAEAKELIAGYTLIQVRSREEAMQWSRRYPNPAGAGRDAVIEVRQLFELDDFVPSPSAERLRELGLPGAAG